MRPGVDWEGVVGERGAHPGHSRVAERAVVRLGGVLELRNGQWRIHDHRDRPQGFGPQSDLD